MIEPAVIPLPRAQKSPEATYVIKNNIFEVHQYRETDTTQNNQQGYINKERIIEQMKQEQGITEQLKAENQMEWVARMNNM